MDQHHGRSRAATTIAAGPARFALTSADCPVFSSQDLRGSRKTLQEQVSHRTSQTSRKPHSADTSIADLRAPFLHDAYKDRSRSSCPANSKTAVREYGIEEQDGASSAVQEKPKLRPFPDLPPLSPPHRPMDDRGGRTGTFDNEVVEISD